MSDVKISQLLAKPVNATPANAVEPEVGTQVLIVRCVFANVAKENCGANVRVMYTAKRNGAQFSTTLFANRTDGSADEHTMESLSELCYALGLKDVDALLDVKEAEVVGRVKVDVGIDGAPKKDANGMTRYKVFDIKPLGLKTGPDGQGAVMQKTGARVPSF